MQFISLLTRWAIILPSFLLMFGQFAYAQNSPAWLVRGNTAFALDLYKQLKEDKSDNLFFSPYSLSTALAMTYAGAKGETAKQMYRVLHFSQAQAELHPAFHLLQSQINAAQNQKNIELNIANALWGQKNYPFLDTFKNDIQKYYGAKLESVDFKTAYQNLHEDINTWVENQTQHKIKNLIKPGVLNNLTRLVLVNAIYFKGNWASPFDGDNTENAPFWVNPNNSITVPMMNQKNYFGYMENDSLQVLELPYAFSRQDTGRFGDFSDNDLSMIILLPKARDGIAQLEGLLSVGKLEKWLEHLRWQKVKVFLPRFKINTGFELSKTLDSMGMPDAFNESQADFSGMGGAKKLAITKVIHQAFVDVNEKGTEAAAATAVIMGTRGMAPPPPTFRADHPFIFLIRHNSSGSILFMGRVINPTQ
ncbi:MAG: serpin family protein [Gammaproteobacteria bacterium]|nr:MAG: serpin family protein [Gammaproteobacteria bacterium]